MFIFPVHSSSSLSIHSADNRVKSSMTEDITKLLLDWQNGDRAALEKLTPLVYDELRRLAGNYLRRERSDHSLQATALVHEAYLRLVGQQEVSWQNRAHFFGIAARLMRQILVDHARAHTAGKRGGGETLLHLDEAVEISADHNADLVALDDALETLGKIDFRKCRVIELRFFGGLTEQETGEVLGISVATVRRESRMAEAWLFREINRTGK